MHIYLLLEESYRKRGQTVMNIWVCGELLIDILPTGAVVGGAPANVAKAIARLGYAVDFIGGVSTDAFGLMARKELERDGVGFEHSLNSKKPTCTATVTLDGDGSATYTFLTENTATFNFEASWLPDPERLKPSVLYIGSLATIIEPASTILYEWAVNCGQFAPIIFDPNVRTTVMADREKYVTVVEKWVGIASIVKLSDDDIAWLYPHESMDEVAKRWIDGGVFLVVLTRGANGLIGFTEHGMEEVESAKVDVVDTVGAGDTVGAILVEGIIKYSLTSLQGHVLNSVLHRASVAAGITVSRVGAQAPHMYELVEAMDL